MRIDEILANGSPVSSAEIGPGVQRLEIHYSAASFAEPSRVRFRVRLNRLDPQWLDVGANRQAVYTNLVLARIGSRVADGPRRQIIPRPLKVRDLWNALAGHQEPAVESPLVGRTQSNHLRVLIAEDNLINQKVVLRMLERLGFRADLAADGAAAVAAAERTSYDLILMTHSVFDLTKKMD